MCAQSLSKQMYDQLDLVGSRPLLLLSDLSSEGGSFNGYALSQLGFQFGTSAMLSSSFYVELAFLQVGGGVGGKVCGGLREGGVHALHSAPRG